MMIRRHQFCICFLVLVSLLSSLDARKPQPTRGFNRKLASITGKLHKQAVSVADGKNTVISPFSISVALGMTLLGAKGNTELEIKNFTHWLWNHQHHEEANVHNVMKRKIRQTTDNGPQLSLNNGVFVDEGYPIDSDFADALKQSYLATQESLDFKHHPSESANKINQWIEEKTDGNLKDMISPDAISSETKLVLVNAIHFAGVWETPFQDKEITKDFYPNFRDESSKIPVTYLTNSKLSILVKRDQLLYERGVFFAIPYEIEIPSSLEPIPQDRDFNTYFVVGKPNTKEDLDWINNNLEEVLGSVKPVSRYGGWHKMRVSVTLPKFDVGMDLDVKTILQNEGFMIFSIHPVVI